MVISSRNAERLQKVAKEMRQKIPASSPASVTPVPCNIRNEEEASPRSFSGSAVSEQFIFSPCLLFALFCACGR